MDIEIRLYVKSGDCRTSRTMLIDEGELDAMLFAFLRYNDYLKEDETLEQISYESVNL